MFQNIVRVKVVVDDLLIWGESDEQHDSRLMRVLESTQNRA